MDLPIVASLTVISRDNAAHLEDIYEAFRQKVDLFVFYLSWWIDEEHARIHEEDFFRRFGETPSRHRGWIGGWRPEDYELLDRGIGRLLARSRRASSPPVTLIPSILGAGNLGSIIRSTGSDSISTSVSPSIRQWRSTSTETSLRAEITTTTWWGM